MWNYIKRFFQKDEVVMGKQIKRVTYTVITDVTYNDTGDWQRKVRAMRKAIKTAIATDNSIKVLKITNTQEN